MVSCTTSNNGTYLVYKAETSSPTTTIAFSDDDYDSSLSDKLAQRFQGKKYNLEFNDKYVVLKEDGSKEEIVLSRASGKFASDPTTDLPFILNYTKAGEKFDIQLYDRTNTSSKAVELYLKVTSDVQDTSDPNYGKYAAIKCELDKRQ